MVNSARSHPRVPRPDRQRGVAAVEAAIVLPLLVLLFLAIGELGRALLEYNTLTKSVRDGARHLATYAIDDFTSVINVTDELAEEAKNLARYGNTEGNGTTVLPNYLDTHLSIDEPDADHVTLIADYPFQPLFNPLPMFGYRGDIPLTFTMQASVTMRALE